MRPLCCGFDEVGRRQNLLPVLLAVLTITSALLTSGCLWGVVRDSRTGAGLSGATVTYTDANGNTGSTTSGPGGLYAFNVATGPVPAVGSATFEVTKPGYRPEITSRPILYNDNPGATLANPSSFWEVQSFSLFLAPGNITTAAGQLSFPTGAVYDKDGNLYFSERGSCRVNKMTAGTGEISAVAGTGVCGFSGDSGPAASAQLNAPSGLALDPQGNLAIVDSGNCRIRRVDLSSNTITTVAGNGTCGFGGDGDAATSASLALSDVAKAPSMFVWSDIAFDALGNMYIADIFNCRVRGVDTAGTITTVAGSGPTGFGCGSFSGDGGPATSARLNGPIAVAAAETGEVFLAELGNCRIRMVDAKTGIITTVAGNGICTSSGDEGAARSAGIANPRGLAIDAAGNLYISEFRFVGAPPVMTPMDCNIRRVDSQTGTISTVAGSNTCGFSGDEGTATSAQINTPADIALSCNEEVAFAEPLNGRIRVVSGISSGGPAGDFCLWPLGHQLRESGAGQ